MSEKRTDNNTYTILFAVIMVLVVGVLLAFTASSLRPKIDENKRIEKQQNILYVMGVNENNETNIGFIKPNEVANKFNKYIKKQLIIEGDKIVEDNNAYLIDIKKEQTNAKQGKIRKLPLFIGEKDGKTFYIVPIMGKGLWDAIWGYVSMDENMVVQGAFFDHKGETPGLGANIKQRYFIDDFIGENLMNDGVFKGISVVKGNNDPKNEDKNDNEVDAIAGATITGDGVSAMIKSELKLYVPYFKKLK
ncbi:MAG: Na(+)-translocating NADH-quinone reductase subunit C [Tenacibaculum sp.]|nr:Na(+)-translocating NADH-quinone reductase subunit C [Tenacibaculum sp.]